MLLGTNYLVLVVFPLQLVFFARSIQQGPIVSENLIDELLWDARGRLPQRTIGKQAQLPEAETEEVFSGPGSKVMWACHGETQKMQPSEKHTKPS